MERKYIMQKLNEKNIKLALQKSGRLTDESLKLLSVAGFEIESYQQRLFAKCLNSPLEILFVRDDDIPDYVQNGTVDLGIVGENMLDEDEPESERLLQLGFGYCSLVVAVPKESEVFSVKQLQDATVATSYPNSTKKFFSQNEVKTKIITIAGSVEITPALGVADAIVDISASGSTMTLNDLRPIETILESQAVLIGNREALKNGRKENIDRILTRFKGVLAAKRFKYVMMNAPKKSLKDIGKIAPGLRSPTIIPLADKGWVALHAVIEESQFWKIAEKLKKLGAEGILVSPIEKIIL